MPRRPSAAADDPDLRRYVAALETARSDYEAAVAALERARERRREAASAAHHSGITWREVAERLGLSSAQEAERLARGAPRASAFQPGRNSGRSRQ